MKATGSLCVPVDLISRFCTLLTNICLHGPAVRSFCLERQQIRSAGLWVLKQASLGAPWLCHCHWGTWPRLSAMLSFIYTPEVPFVPNLWGCGETSAKVVMPVVSPPCLGLEDTQGPGDDGGDDPGAPAVLSQWYLLPFSGEGSPGN